ncbi:GNAT family N-acetyltransferase [Microbacterium sp. BK668]|uniref:GNAT family N-acetyltransferase n=1 Tax=Microbacterium sp. BK668 TaxID=2512118 RepID=UPI00105B87D1|nr:GNAT family N-acetyltransferase [Microbacterium sp. BK668]TDN91751.1 RimJ/RimL family protein N-acetyltransferase [Microbacterium sp. BK668]
MTLAAASDIVLIAADPRRDAALVRGWLADPHASFWGMADLSEDEVMGYLSAVATHPDQDSWVGLVDGRPMFLVETYDPARVLLRGIHRAREGDLGMHVLISSPTGEPRHGLTDAVFAAVMRWCFDTLGARRVVVEPDIANEAIARKNARAGFRVLRVVDVPDGQGVKRAALSICTRADFAASILGSLR